MSCDKFKAVCISLLIYISGSLIAFAQEPEIIFEEGVQKYTSDNFDEAILLWEKLVSSGYSSAGLYYNLGNANFKNEDIAASILYYEKALLIKPFNEDIKYNLEIARSYITDNFETIPELFLIRWYRMVSLLLDSNYWAIISVIIFALSLALVLIYLFSGSIRLKKISLSTALVIFMFSIISLSLSYQNSLIRNKRQDAIIFSPAVTGKSSPDQSGIDLFVIHEGTKVRVVDELGGWYEIRLSDGNIGWIPIGDARKV